MRGNFKRAAKHLYVSAQVADMHVRAVFELRHCWLAYSKRFRDLFLQMIARPAQLLQRHFLAQLRGLCCDAHPALGLKALGKAAERPMAGHGINPSFFSSLL